VAEVIAVEYAVLTKFAGSSFGVPIATRSSCSSRGDSKESRPGPDRGCRGARARRILVRYGNKCGASIRRSREVVRCGLLLLRLVVGSVLVVYGASKLWGDPPLQTTLTSASLTGFGLLLIAGLWTPWLERPWPGSRSGER
jgi:hypothetical protein